MTGPHHVVTLIRRDDLSGPWWQISVNAEVQVATFDEGYARVVAAEHVRRLLNTPGARVSAFGVHAADGVPVPMNLAFTSLFPALFPAPDAVPRARASDPATSHDAAASMRAAAHAQRDSILTVLRAYGPQTSAEVDARLGWTDRAHRRMKELETAGRVARVPGVTRPTPRGRQAEVWRAVPDAGEATTFHKEAR